MGEGRVEKSFGNWRWRVVVMVRDPVAGAVKTRLGRGIGVSQATGFYRHVSCNVVERLHADMRWETWLAVTPDTAVASTSWPAAVPRRGQGPGNLGRRMQRVFDEMAPGPVVIVGTDIPEINAARIADAFAALGTADAVFGPAEDGGYWLIGQARRRRVAQIFAGVRWSSPHTLADTQANMGKLAVAHVGVLDDVDDATSFARIGGLAGRRILPVRGPTDN